MLSYLCIYLIFSIVSATKIDNIENRYRGNATVVFGALIGEVDIIRRGYSLGGSPSAFLDPYVGKWILELGIPFHDFPVLPALHAAFSQGQLVHFEAAIFLVRSGADMSEYVLPDMFARTKESNSSLSKCRNVRGYAPAIMYCMGFGAPLTTSHAAFIQRLWESHPSHFKLDKISNWLALTGNAPLLHTVVRVGYFEGLYVLINDMKMNVNERDAKHGTTALHIAVWEGRLDMIDYLMHSGASVIIQDNHGRTPLHYAVLRGFQPVVWRLFKNAPDLFCPMLTSALDVNKQTSFDIGYSRLPRKVLAIQQIIDIMADSSSTHCSTLLLAQLKNPNASKCFVPDVIPNKRKSEECSNILLETKKFAIGLPSPLGAINSVDTIDATAITQSKFIRDYVQFQLPLVLKSGEKLFHKQNIWVHAELDSFISRYGDIVLYRGIGLYERYFSNIDPHYYKFGSLPVSSMKCREYYEIFRNWGSSFVAHNDYILANRYDNDPDPHCELEMKNKDPEVHSKLIEDITTPEFFSGICGKYDHDTWKLSVGPAATSMPLRAHNSSWDILLSGRRKWIIMPPGHSLYAFQKVNSISELMMKENEVLVGDSESGTITLDSETHFQQILPVEEWLIKYGNSLLRAGLASEFIQYPGDIVYLPHHWSYTYLNIEDSISVSQEFCTFQDTDQRFMPVGNALYGGEDDYRRYKYPLGRMTSKLIQRSASTNVADSHIPFLY